MTNKEKYSKEITEIAIDGRVIVLVNGVPMACADARCINCDLYEIGKCNYDSVSTWANSEYIEAHPCQSCKVDDKVLVRDREDEPWKRRYFEKISFGYVYCYADGCTSWSSTDEPVPWKHGKPYTGEEDLE